jgi:hypothetical protein
MMLDMQTQIRGSEKIPLVQPHRRFMHQSWLHVVSEVKLVPMSTSKRRMTTSSLTPFDVNELQQLSERTVNKQYLFCRFSDLIVQCRQLGERSYELVRSVVIRTDAHPPPSPGTKSFLESDDGKPSDGMQLSESVDSNCILFGGD